MRIYTHDKGIHYVNALHATDNPQHGREYQVAFGPHVQFLQFQGGPVGSGNDYLLNEQLLAVLQHRLTVLHSRAPDDETLQALAHITEAQALLECRARQHAQ